MLYGMLPLLKGWIYHYDEKTGTTKPGGKEEIIIDVKAPGYVLVFSYLIKGSLDAKHVHIRVEMEGPDKLYALDVTPYGIYTFGVVTPISYGGFLLRYDDTEKIYTGAVSPSRPIPFTKRFVMKIVPPAQPIEETSALPIEYTGVFALIRITDTEAFKNSLRELLFGGAITPPIFERAKAPFMGGGGL